MVTPVSMVDSSDNTRNSALSCLEGQRISCAWLGGANCLFLELGELSAPSDKKPGKGEFTVLLEYGWRVEKDTDIVAGPADDVSLITFVLESLTGEVLLAPVVQSGPPELILALESGYRIVTFSGLAGDPEWSVQLPGGDYVSVSAGEITVSPQ